MTVISTYAGCPAPNAGGPVGPTGTLGCTVPPHCVGPTGTQGCTVPPHCIIGHTGTLGCTMPPYCGVGPTGTLGCTMPPHCIGHTGTLGCTMPPQCLIGQTGWLGCHNTATTTVQTTTPVQGAAAAPEAANVGTIGHTGWLGCTMPPQCPIGHTGTFMCTHLPPQCPIGHTGTFMCTHLPPQCPILSAPPNCPIYTVTGCPQPTTTPVQQGAAAPEAANIGTIGQTGWLGCTMPPQCILGPTGTQGCTMPPNCVGPTGTQGCGSADAANAATIGITGTRYCTIVPNMCPTHTVATVCTQVIAHCPPHTAPPQCPILSAPPHCPVLTAPPHCPILSAPPHCPIYTVTGCPQPTTTPVQQGAAAPQAAVGTIGHTGWLGCTMPPQCIVGPTGTQGCTVPPNCVGPTGTQGCHGNAAFAAAPTTTIGHTGTLGCTMPPHCPVIGPTGTRFCTHLLPHCPPHTAPPQCPILSAPPHCPIYTVTGCPQPTTTPVQQGAAAPEAAKVGVTGWQHCTILPPGCQGNTMATVCTQIACGTAATTCTQGGGNAGAPAILPTVPVVSCVGACTMDIAACTGFPPVC